MSTLIHRTREFLNGEDGPTATEYAIMLAFVIVVAIVSIRAFGVGLGTTFDSVSNAMFG
jgi:pilus assembly protein Flp/PilA